MSDEPKQPPTGRVFHESVSDSARASDAARLIVTRPLPADSQYLPLIGKAVTEWARFEAALDKIIWTLAGLNDQLGSSITSGLQGAHTRLKIIHALAFYRGATTKTLTRINKLKEDSAKHQETRNRIAHDPWHLVDEDTRPSGYVVRSQGVKKAEKGYIFGQQETGTEYIETVISNAPKLIKKASHLLKEIRTITR